MSPGRRVFALLSDGSRCSLRGDISTGTVAS
jgi:hypothetical protein